VINSPARGVVVQYHCCPRQRETEKQTLNPLNL
jgi:hypothetical protein